MFNDALTKALAQARDVQKNITAAATEAAEQMKPHIEKSIDSAKAMQATLSRHAAESGVTSSKGAEGAMGHLGDFIKMGNDAMKESVDLTRATTLKMVDQSKKIVDAANAAISKGRE
jgi:hypothetical protein